MKRLAAMLTIILAAVTNLFAETIETRVTLSDGVELATFVHLPADGGPFPVVLVRTPYGKNGMASVVERFAAAGYAVVVQEVRGTFGSQGRFVPFVHEEKDGLETLDWIAKAPWSNGRVATFGSSYLGHCGLILARHGHPALRTVFSASGWIGTEKMNAPGGALHLELSMPWLLLFGNGESPRSAPEVDMDVLFRHLPLSGAFDSIGIDVPAWKDPRMLRAYQGASESRVAIPVFHLTGWYDFAAPAALDTWRAMRGASDAPQRLMVGPWIHDQVYTEETAVGELEMGSEAAMGIDRLTRLAIEWFDCHLRDRCSDSSPVRVFVIGENRWRDFASWPPKESRTRTFHLESRGDAATRHAGRLASSPSRRAGSDRFTFDPNNPVPTLGGANVHFFPETIGPRDQSELERRADVAVYTSEPLKRDLLLAGPVRAVLHVSTRGRDTDFAAKLTHVTADGRSMSIVDGFARLSRRNGLDTHAPVEPGEVVEIAVDMGEIAMTIPSGDRLRVAVTSSNFPKFDRNPNTGEDPFEAATLVPVEQTIHHGKTHPSRLEITAIELETRSGQAARPDTRKQPTAGVSADPAAVAAGVALFEAGRFEDARAHFAREAASTPGAALHHFWLGRSLLALEQTDAAIASLERAVELEPGRSDAHLWLGRANATKLQAASTFQRSMLAGDVRQSYEKAVALDPSSVEARLSLARYYLSAPGVAGGSRAKAMQQLEAVVALDPSQGHGLLAQIHVERKEWPEAEAAFRRAVEHAPGNGELHYQMGRMYQDREMWPEAAASFEAAIAASPDLGTAWYQLGRTGAMSGTNLDRALDALDVYIERFAETADPAFRGGAWWRKGQILESMGKPDDAIAAYERAVAINPDHEPSAKALASLRKTRAGHP